MVLSNSDKYRVTRTSASIDLDEPPPARYQAGNDGGRKRRHFTRLEKLLLVALLVLTAICLAIVVLVFFFTSRQAPPPSPPAGSGCSAPARQMALPKDGDTDYSANTIDHSSSNDNDGDHFGSSPVTNGSHIAIPNSTVAPECRKVCDTPQCVRVAYRMLQNLDPEVDPCQDFYRYACGGWQRTNSPDHEPRSVFAHNMVDKVDRALKDLLESEGPLEQSTGSAEELQSFQKVRLLYSSCMLESVIQRRMSEPGKILLNNIGTYHTNATWIESSFDLTTLLADLLMSNGAPYFDVGYDVETESPLNLTIVISLPVQAGIVTHYKPNSGVFAEPPIGLVHKEAAAVEDVDGGNFKEFFEQHKELGLTLDADFIFNYMKISLDRRTDEKMYDSIREFFDRSTNDSEQMSLEKELRDFMSRLRDIVPTPKQLKLADDRDETDKWFTLAELQLQFNHISWKRLLQRLFGRPFKDGDRVKVTSPTYFQQLSKLFDDFGLRLANNVALALFSRDVMYELMHEQKDMERWEFCVRAAKVALPDVLSAMFLRSYSRQYLDRVFKDVDSMFQIIKTSFSEAVERSSWIDNPTKKLAEAKINNMKGSFVGSPVLYNDSFLIEITSNVTIKEHLFFENILLCYRLMRKRMYDIYTTEFGPSANPFVVNAFYQYNMNKIVVALGLLSSPYYSIGEPKYVTYGSLGTTIGHEITHGFDVTGIQYDQTGKKRPWVSDSVRKGYEQKTGCIADMYSSFQQKIKFLDTDVNISFDGNFTLNENFADNSGILLAFRAYNLWLETNGEEAVLPGLNLTSQQILFLSAAQASCAVMTPISYVFTLELDEHTPEPERVNAFLMNSQHFVDIFQCPQGSPMNAASKCSLW